MQNLLHIKRAYEGVKHSQRHYVTVTNPVRDLPLTPHQRSLAHHIDSCTTQTVAQHFKLQFPSSIALTTHSCHQSHIALITQLITLITQAL